MKLIKVGMDTREVVVRFEFECQAPWPSWIALQLNKLPDRIPHQWHPNVGKSANRHTFWAASGILRRVSQQFSSDDVTSWNKARPNAFLELDPEKVSGPIAVLVFHGMGQQAQFESLNDVVEALIQAHVERSWTVKRRQDNWLECEMDGTVDLTKPRSDSDVLLPSAQVTLQTPDGRAQQEFDVFEAYWAPLTEGVATAWDTLLFLLRAAADGIFASLVRGGFRRFLFGVSNFFPVSRWVFVQLILAALVVTSIAALALAYVGVVGHDILTFLGIGIHAMDRCTDALQRILSWFVVPSLVALGFPLVNALVQKRRSDPVSRAARIANVIWVVPVLSTLIYFGLAVIVSVATHGWNSVALIHPPPKPRPPGARLMFAGIGGVMLIAIWYFTVKFLGDVVAYVSAHSVNRFWKVRELVQERCLNVAKAVYTRKHKEDPEKLLYDHIVVVGHSLGSVIGYDVLNWLTSLEICGAHPPCVIKVADRTRLFLTCGSPLNKIAFLFRFGVGIFSGQCIWRDRLSNYRQPLILNYRWRPDRWINIWSYPDWISGKLSYFEDPRLIEHSELTDWVRTSSTKELMPQALRIQNLADADAFVPLYEHTTYFRHQQFRTAIYHGLWTRAAMSWPDGGLERAGQANK